MTTEEIVNALERQINECLSQLRHSENSIVKCNFIVEFGAYSVGKNENGQSELKICPFPAQWCEKGVQEIKEKMRVENNQGEKIDPKVTPYKEWYRKKLKNAWDARKILRKVLLEE